MKNGGVCDRGILVLVQFFRPKLTGHVHLKSQIKHQSRNDSINQTVIIFSVPKKQEPNYVYHKTDRKRAERKKLAGFDCAQCDGVSTVLRF